MFRRDLAPGGGAARAPQRGIGEGLRDRADERIALARRYDFVLLAEIALSVAVAFDMPPYAASLAPTVSWRSCSNGSVP